jgi:hypothetical protein
LIGGPRSTLTSDRGVYFFSNLPPGAYELTFSLSGFQTIKRERIQVRVDATVTEDVALSTEVIQESVTVVAPTPVRWAVMGILHVDG